jgi:hypothetical protein
MKPSLEDGHDEVELPNRDRNPPSFALPPAYGHLTRLRHHPGQLLLGRFQHGPERGIAGPP